MKNDQFSRRNFIKKSAVASGIVAMNPFLSANSTITREVNQYKLPREVWIAAISQMDIYTNTSRSMIDRLAKFTEDLAVYKPDIICLPETFPSVNIDQQLSISEMVDVSEIALQKFSDLAKQSGSYIICPVHISKGGKVYNAGVVFDRNGTQIGEYLKAHPTIGEIESGVTPGTLYPPVFQTDFGKIGIQICYDIYWNDGWKSLKDQGAEIVFWPSAFAAGQRVNTKAWENQYIVVSSTRKNTTKICDIRGEVIAQTGIWERNHCCGSVNLEKVLIDTWPHVRHFDEIRKKYGRKVRITTFHEEQWSVVESLSSEIFVADILKEFGLKTYKQDTDEAEAAQIKARRN